MENQTSGNSGSEGNDFTFTPTDDQPIFFTPGAVDEDRNALKSEGEEGDALRVSGVGGGWSGYQYKLDFEKRQRMGE